MRPPIVPNRAVLYRAVRNRAVLHWAPVLYAPNSGRAAALAARPALFGCDRRAGLGRPNSGGMHLGWWVCCREGDIAAVLATSNPGQVQVLRCKNPALLRRQISVDLALCVCDVVPIRCVVDSSPHSRTKSAPLRRLEAGPFAAGEPAPHVQFTKPHRYASPTEYPSFLLPSWWW